MTVRTPIRTTTAILATASVLVLPVAADASPDIACGTVRTAQGTRPVTTFGAGADCRTARSIIRAVVTRNGYRRAYRGWTCDTYERTLSCGASGARNAGSTLRRTKRL
jgi:hypothetical protein